MSTPWAMAVLMAEIRRLTAALAAADARGDILAQELTKAEELRDKALEGLNKNLLLYGEPLTPIWGPNGVTK